jgi:hypothetical protein
MDEAIIILQVQRNTRLPVERCDNYNIKGAEKFHLPVQGCGNYNTTGAGEYQAAVQGCSSYNTNGAQEYQYQTLYKRDEAIGIKWWTLIIGIPFSLYARVWQLAIDKLQVESHRNTMLSGQG